MKPHMKHFEVSFEINIYINRRKKMELNLMKKEEYEEHDLIHIMNYIA